jgi:hypothetical protein
MQANQKNVREMDDPVETAIRAMEEVKKLHAQEERSPAAQLMKFMPPPKRGRGRPRKNTRLHQEIIFAMLVLRECGYRPERNATTEDRESACSIVSKALGKRSVKIREKTIGDRLWRPYHRWESLPIAERTFPRPQKGEEAHEYESRVKVWSENFAGACLAKRIPMRAAFEFATFDWTLSGVLHNSENCCG